MQLRTTPEPEENRTYTPPQQQTPAPVNAEAHRPQTKMEPVAAEQSKRTRPRLDLNVNNLPEEIVEIKVKWLALCCVGLFGLTTLYNVALNEGRNAWVSHEQQQRIAHQPTSGVTTVIASESGLLTEWIYPGAIEGREEADVHWRHKTFQVEKPFKDVWQYYQQKLDSAARLPGGMPPARPQKISDFKSSIETLSGTQIGHIYMTESERQISITLFQSANGHETIEKVLVCGQAPQPTTPNAP